MYMEYLFYLKTLPEAERTNQILIIFTVLAILFLVAITLEIINKKYANKIENFKKFFTKLNIFNRKKENQDV